MRGSIDRNGENIISNFLQETKKVRPHAEEIVVDSKQAPKVFWDSISCIDPNRKKFALFAVIISWSHTALIKISGIIFSSTLYKHEKKLKIKHATLRIITGSSQQWNTRTL